MATPNLVTVNGQIMIDDEVPDPGAVITFKRPYPTYHADGTVYEPLVERAETDAEGLFTIVLVSGTDPDWSPVNWAYTVTVKPGDGGRPWSFSTIVDGADGEVLSFGELNPITSPPMPQLYALANHTHPAVEYPAVALTSPLALDHRAKTGLWPVSMVLLGDSTGNSPDEWFYGLASWLTTRWPTYRVRYQLWDHASQAYAVPVYLGLGSSVRRVVTVPASSGINFQTPNSTALTITGDLDVRATVTLDTMPPGQNVDICGKTASAPNRSWWMSVTSTGFLQLSWSNDGTTTLSQTSSVAIPAGAKTLRAVLDVDNGAGQYTVIFYTSTNWDGSTGQWTQLGTTRTGATGVTTVFAGTSTTQLISRSNGTWGVPGTATALQVFSGTACVIDMDMGTFADGATTMTDYTGNVWTVIGSPARAGDLVFSVYNGSVAGETVSYANDSTRFPKLTPMTADLAFISYGHNETGITYPGFSTLASALVAKWPQVGVVPVLQNPETLTAKTQAQINAHAMRMDLVAALAGVSRWPVMDVYRAFLDSGTALTTLVPDGLHPSPAGTAMWLALAKKLFA